MELVKELIIWIAVWIAFTFLLSLTPLSAWNQGAWTVMLTLLVNRFLFGRLTYTD